MPLATMPAVDANACSGWTEQDRTLYNALPYYFAKQQVDRRKWTSTYDKLIGKVRWKPNMGPIMRGVRWEPSPHMRQFAFPNPISASMPKKDVMDVREVKQDAIVYSHDFESPVFQFYPDFVNFMSHIDDNGKDIMDKIVRFNDMFLRGVMFHMAPFVLICTGNDIVLTDAPIWTGAAAFNEANDGKKKDWVAGVAPTVTGTLGLLQLNKALNILETDLRVPFFEGNGGTTDDEPLKGKFLLIQDSESFNNFSLDPLLLQYKKLDLDIIQDNFHGNLFGRITCRLEDLPLRYAIDGAYFTPEVRVEGGNPYNLGETLPNPLYTRIGPKGNDAANQCSPIGVAWLCGAGAYDGIEVGPPPAPFSGNEAPENFMQMQWNGEVRLTKNLLVPCVDAVTGQIVYETNQYGKYVKFISEATFGAIPKQRRNMIPILYKRIRGLH